MSSPRMTVGARLIIGFGLVFALLTAVIGVSLVRLDQFNSSIDSFSSNRVPKMIGSGSWIESLLQSATNMRTALLLDEEKLFKAEIASVVQSQKKRKDFLDQMGKTVQPGEEQKLYQAVADAHAAYLPHEDEFLKVAGTGDFASAKDVMLGRVATAQLKYIDLLKSFIAFESERARQDAFQVNASYRNSRLLIMGLALLSFLIGGLAAYLITRSLMRELGGEPNYAADVANRIASGDLASEVVIKLGDSTSVLAVMQRMQTNLHKVVSDVRQGSEGVATASAEIAQGNHDLSARTEQQASALEETAASMEELSSTVRQNADNAKQANQLAQSASTVAVKGGNVVGQVVETMKGINDASRKISDIISVIDGIAFQTNILALNAAVEAARAGEQGRGFAVVASEVRSLAGRSADAAKEIKTLINTSVERVEQGTALVDQAGVTMTEVVSSIRRVTDIMGEISAASTEQNLGVAQVGEAVTQIDQATQQNAALVEEMAAAASSLKSQAQELVGTVAVFKLGAHDSHHGLASAEAVRSRQTAVGGYKNTERRVLAPPPKPASRPASPKIVAKGAAPAMGGDADWETF